MDASENFLGKPGNHGEVEPAKPALAGVALYCLLCGWTEPAPEGSGPVKCPQCPGGVQFVVLTGGQSDASARIHPASYHQVDSDISARRIDPIPNLS